MSTSDFTTSNRSKSEASVADSAFPPPRARKDEATRIPKKHSGAAAGTNTAGTNTASTNTASTNTVPQEKASPDSRDKKQKIGGFATSLTLHLVALLILACFVLPGENLEEMLTVFGAISDEEPIEELIEVGLATEDEVAEVVDMNLEEIVDTEPRIELNVNDLVPSLEIEDTSFKGPSIQINLNSDFGGRSKAARAALVRAHGGNSESEAAVERGLKWLAEHQSSDGSWSFAHHINERCSHECNQPGFLRDCRTGATAMSLLAFLGAGNTPDRGQYRKVVGYGIEYLIRQMELSSDGGDLQGEGQYKSMYVHGLASLALCEAYAMSKPHSEVSGSVKRSSSTKAGKKTNSERETRLAAGRRKNLFRKSKRNRSLSLAEAAQYAVDFITYAQDSRGGGWRYRPRTQGDTSAVGWQLMAMQSARTADLGTEPQVFERVSYFLDSVQAQGGAQYGYMSPTAGQVSTTAVGLLCRMYLGWTRDNPALRAGIGVLDESGPEYGDMYYNYYATQVMHHWGGEPWKKWNEVMRNHLVETQIRTKHATGSWDVADRHGHQGGRLYMTCLCIMTLEVYYRHLPLYQREMLEKTLQQPVEE